MLEKRKILMLNKIILSNFLLVDFAFRYCKDIVIHDIQSEEKWLFKINQTLSVCHEYRIRVAPMGTSKNKLKSIWDILRLSGEHETWNIFVEYVINDLISI